MDLEDVQHVMKSGLCIWDVPIHGKKNLIVTDVEDP